MIGKTPSITIGKSSTISIAVKNTTDTDWLESEIWIAPEADYQGYYDEIEDEDGEIIKTMNATYPFEITDSLNKHYKIGHINAGAKKTVNLRVNVKKNLKEGYYPVKLYISKRSRGEDGMSGEFQKTVMVWAETKEASSTSESDESSTEPIGFALGENQSTPQANYNEVMNFNMNLRNTGYKTAYDVRVEMELSEDITKFPFEINDGNYDRWMNNINPDQTVEVPYSMAIREEAKSGYYPIKFKIRYREEENGAFLTPVEDTFYVRVIGKDEEDVIDFVARLFDLSSYEAAQRLAADFGISTEPGQPVAVPHKLKHPYIRQFREDEMLCFRVLTDYLHLLEDWKVWYAPKTPDDALDDRFVEACQMIDYIEYLADILTVGDLEERVAVVDELMKNGKITFLQDYTTRKKKEDMRHERRNDADLAL